jgi:hypothetical protein
MGDMQEEDPARKGFTTIDGDGTDKDIPLSFQEG